MPFIEWEDANEEAREIFQEIQLETLVEGYEQSSLFSEREKAAIRWAEALTRLEAKGDDPAFARLKEHFSDAEIVELTLASAIFNCFNRFTDPMHISLEAGSKYYSCR